MSPLHRNFRGFCAAIPITTPLGAFAQGVLIGQGLVKTDVGECVRSGDQTWACLGAAWRDEGTVPGGAGTRYSCTGTIMEGGTYTTVSTARTAVALTDLKLELDGVAAKVAKNADSIEALRRQLEAQFQSSNQLLYEAVAARFDAVPARVLTDKALKDALAKLRDDVLAAVKANGPPVR